MIRRAVLVAFGLLTLSVWPGRAQEPDLIHQLAAEVNGLILRVEQQQATIDSLLALPAGDPELEARVDSLVAVLSVERASHAAVVDSLEQVIAELREGEPPAPVYTASLGLVPDSLLVGASVVVGVTLFRDGDELVAAIEDWEVETTGGWTATPEDVGIRLTATSPGPATVAVTHRDLLASASASTRVVEPVIVDPPDPGENLTPASLRRILGPLVARGTVQDTILSRFESRFRQTEHDRFCGFAGRSYKASCTDFSIPGGMGPWNAHHYGALLSRLNHSIRNGEPYGPTATDVGTVYGRGHLIVHDYLMGYSGWRVGGGAAPHNNTGLIDIAALYVLHGGPVPATGQPADSLLMAARHHIWLTGIEATTDANGYRNFTNANSDGRQPAIALQAAMLAHQLGIPWARPSNPGTSRGMNLSHGSWIGAGRWLIDHMLTPTGHPNRGYIAATGAVWSTAHAGQAGGAHNEAYLFNAMMATALLQWWGWVDPYPAAHAAAKRIMDHIIDIDDVARAAGRTTIPYLTNSGGSSLAAEDLASFYVWPALVLWQETNDTRYRTFALRQLAAANRTSSISAVKQWNQVVSMHTQGAEALLSGVSWR